MASMNDDKNGKSLRGSAAAIGLSKGQVVSAAVAQIDEKGLAAFSLNELGSCLGSRRRSSTGMRTAQRETSSPSASLRAIRSSTR